MIIIQELQEGGVNSYTNYEQITSTSVPANANGDFGLYGVLSINKSLTVQIAIVT